MKIQLEEKEDKEIREKNDSDHKKKLGREIKEIQGTEQEIWRKERKKVKINRRKEERKGKYEETDRRMESKVICWWQREDKYTTQERNR